jgi:UDP-GlcNAc:undecaprenyl-phosphate GlcNAc-1-phosphate transferase
MLYTFVLVFLLTILFIRVIRNNAKKWNLIDVPNERSTHKTYTARGAGIAFYLAVMLVVPFFYFDLIVAYIWTTLAIFLIFLIGVIDDFTSTSPRTKFIFIIVSTIFLSFDHIMITQLHTFFGFDITLSWFALPFSIFVVSGFTNALNLIDGLDGLAATISLVILTTFFYLGYRYNDMFMMLLSGVFMATLLAFLLYNWYPASIFMGDSGSLLLGFVISILAIKSLSYIPPISILFLGALPIIDTLVVMIRRKKAGRSFFSADSCHMHHLCKTLFANSTPKTVLFLGMIQIIYSIIGLQLSLEVNQGWILVLFIVNILCSYIVFDKMIEKQKREC